MASTLTMPSALPDEYIQQTKSLREKAAQELAEIRAAIAELQMSERRLMAQLSAMDEIVGNVDTEVINQHPTTEAEGDSDQPITRSFATERSFSAGLLDGARELSSEAAFGVGTEERLPYGVQTGSAINRTSRNSPALAESVEAVVDTLREYGPMHYRSIYDQVAAKGISVIGKDPAAVLLSRFTRDDRIRRVGSGTYAIED